MTRGERFLIGHHGPEVRLPPEACAALQPFLTAWWQQQLDRGAPADGALGQVVAAIEHAAQVPQSSASGTSGTTTPANHATVQPTATITTSQAAEATGRTARAIRKAAEEGRIPGARRQGRQWLIPADWTRPVRQASQSRS